jgi:hypothetical protein
MPIREASKKLQPDIGLSNNMAKTFQEIWIDWASGAKKTKPLPDDNVADLAAWLWAIHKTLREGRRGRKEGSELFKATYVGPLVDKAIRAWRTPNSQIKVTRRALKKGGSSKALRKEHDPPVMFYRDKVCGRRPISRKTFIEYLTKMTVTWVTTEDNRDLNRKGFKSIRPPTAYAKCRITRLRVPQDWETRRRTPRRVQ